MKADTAWSVSVESLNEHVARVVFAPPETPTGPTFAVQSAVFSPVALSATHEARVCGGAVRVRAVPDGRPPHAGTLLIEWTQGGTTRTWRPGDLDHENLGAAFLSLDNLWRDYIPTGVHAYDPLVPFDEYFWNISTLTLELEFAHKAHQGVFFDTEARNQEVRRMLRGEKSQVFPEWPPRAVAALERIRHSPPGFFTRSGLTLFRDSTWPWDATRQWIQPHPPTPPVVLYLIHHACDWKLLCSQLVGLLGPIPRIADRFMGIWYSNYAPLGQEHFRRLADDFDQYDLPLDIISVDMDWHGKEWYGYGWAPDFFPDAPAFGRWLDERDLKSTFNIHPLYLPATEPRLDEFRAASGCANEVHGPDGDWHPYQANCVRVDIHNQRHAEAYFKIFLEPVERCGCHFWWIDGSYHLPDGRDECSWMNHAFRAHLARQKDRLPIVLARAGGLGAHRDAILFTGDACSQWEVLAFEVETTVRAAGALIAYVSHDIGGFYHDPADRAENKPPDDLYIRWVQFGCLSAIMRLHSFNGVREPWRFAPATLEITRRYFHLRMRLLPYTTALLDEAHATGVPPVRPVWMEFPQEDAYRCTHQYMLGPDLLVAPVATESGEVRYWLPPGEWHDAFSTRVEKGPQWIAERVPLERMPLWVRGGASITLAEPRRRTAEALAGPRQVVRGGGWA
jgi:hypothetical protein